MALSDSESVILVVLFAVLFAACLVCACRNQFGMLALGAGPGPILAADDDDDDADPQSLLIN